MSLFWFMVGTLVVLSLGVSILFLLMRRVRTSRAGMHGNTHLVPEVYIDRGSFTLLGSHWTWIGNEAASYGCPRCGCREDVTLRLYKYAKTNQVYILTRHICERPTPDKETEPVLSAASVGRAS